MEARTGPGGSGINIRPAIVSDASRLAQLAARTFEDTFGDDNDPEDMSRHVTETYGALQQGREIADANISTLVVEADSQFVGYAQLRRGPVPACVTGSSPIELWRFYVDRNWHGRGIAQQLMRCVVRVSKQCLAETLWLGVWERNERAKAFYRKCGFVDVGAHVFNVGSDAQTDRIFVCSVAAIGTA